jgi:hypothetical protein
MILLFLGKTIRNLSRNVVEELQPFTMMHKFKGHGQQNTMVLTYTGVIRMLMLLGGKNVALIRAKFADVIQKYLAGDLSLMAEIEANLASTSSVNESARAAMNDPPVQEGGVGGDRMEDVEFVTWGALQKYTGALHNVFKKQRRLELTDGTRQIKLYHEQTNEEVTRAEKLNKLELAKLKEASELAITQTKANTELVIEERKKLETELNLLKYRSMFNNPPPSTPGITVREVAIKYDILKDVDNNTTVEHILGQAGANLRRGINAIIPYDKKKRETTSLGEILDVNQYAEREELKIKEFIQASLNVAIRPIVAIAAVNPINRYFPSNK